MSADRRQASDHLERLLRQHSQEELLARLTPHTDEPSAKVPGGAHLSDDAVDMRSAAYQPIRTR